MIVYTTYRRSAHSGFIQLRQCEIMLRSTALLSIAVLPRCNGLVTSPANSRLVHRHAMAALRPSLARMMSNDASFAAIPGFETTYTVLKPGAGDAVAKGATVTVHATGVVAESGQKFWCAKLQASSSSSAAGQGCERLTRCSLIPCRRSTKDPGQEPFTYQAGVGSVIVGWDQGLLGMQLGEERKLVIPAAEGYGERGFPAWGIPAGGTLEFTLEVLSIK